jgi:hypothetical protein
MEPEPCSARNAATAISDDRLTPRGGDCRPNEWRKRYMTTETVHTRRAQPGPPPKLPVCTPPDQPSTPQCLNSREIRQLLRRSLRKFALDSPISR